MTVKLSVADNMLVKYITKLSAHHVYYLIVTYLCFVCIDYALNFSLYFRLQIITVTFPGKENTYFIRYEQSGSTVQDLTIMKDII